MDTRAFYTDDEMEIDKRISELQRRKATLKNPVKALERYYSGKINEKQLRLALKSQNYINDMNAPLPSQSEVAEMQSEVKRLTNCIDKDKIHLRTMIESFTGVREFREEYFNDWYIISFFESNLTRTLGIKPGTLTTDLIVVQTFYRKVFRDIVCDGFMLHGEKYRFYAASAGQTRDKKSVFIKESLWEKYSPKLMCGLTVDRINQTINKKTGEYGINISKYLAYLALNNTATDPWPEFDIDRCIVVDDFETDVTGVVDFVDEIEYEDVRRIQDVPITHTDGCGMMLPSVSKNNRMIRLPWVKGLLSPFNFKKFLIEAKKTTSRCHIIKDIYGQEHNVLAENIQIIFTKSMFKMHQYYSSWDEYKQYFKEYGCEVGICKEDSDEFEYARTNYQMLQTLTDLTDDELKAPCAKTVEKLNKVSSDRETMLNVFGATGDSQRKTAFQKALSLYPELLQDEYCRFALSEQKKAIIKEAVAGHLDIEGYYTFLLPDLYAFCQHLFLSEDVPTGLLQDGEVYCNLFDTGMELDCLRSPHLYKEHAVRINAFGINAEAGQWFKTNGIYTSSHDLISKILQHDCDGDTSLVVSNPTLVNAAKRNMQDVVPLFYPMAKAGARQITPEAIYNTLNETYSGDKIGDLSNEITRIWNCDHIDTLAIKLVKLDCMENNFAIDRAKTSYMPKRPDHIKDKIKPYIKDGYPHFFIEAKGKSKENVAPLNSSSVNRIRSMIPHPRLNFSVAQLGKFDWHCLMSGKRLPIKAVKQEIVEAFHRLSRCKYNTDPETGDTNWWWHCQKIRDELLAIHDQIDGIVDTLVEDLFHAKKSKNKKVFWDCFGQEVLKNIQKNVDRTKIMCRGCGNRFEATGTTHKYCPECSRRRRLEQERERSKRNRERNRQHKKMRTHS